MPERRSNPAQEGSGAKLDELVSGNLVLLAVLKMAGYGHLAADLVAVSPRNTRGDEWQCHQNSDEQS